jgi:predicted transcriptional regulator
MADSMDTVFVALGSPARRKILDIVKDRPGCTVKHVAAFFKMSRIAVMKHLRILVQAGLVISEKEGRSRRLYFNCVPIQMIYDRWTTEYSALWASGMTKVKYRVEMKETLHGRG